MINGGDLALILICVACGLNSTTLANQAIERQYPQKKEFQKTALKGRIIGYKKKSDETFSPVVNFAYNGEERSFTSANYYPKEKFAKGKKFRIYMIANSPETAEIFPMSASDRMLYILSVCAYIFGLYLVISLICNVAFS